MEARSAIVISDVHENISWKEMVAARGPADRVIFLGDYFDQRGHGPWADDAIANFNEICDYAKNNPETVLLTGNHDYMYLPWSIQIGPDGWTERDLAIQKAVLDRIDLLQMVFVDRSPSHPLVFSHAGVTRTFLDMNGLAEPEELNRLWIESPEKFEWRLTNPERTEMSRLDGDNVWQSPIWTRTDSLFRDAIQGYSQVVGHTPVSRKGMLETSHGDRILLTCDFSDDLLRLTN